MYGNYIINQRVNHTINDTAAHSHGSIAWLASVPILKSVCLFVRLYLCVCLFVCLFVCMFVCLSPPAALQIGNVGALALHVSGATARLVSGATALLLFLFGCSFVIRSRARLFLIFPCLTHKIHINKK